MYVVLYIRKIAQEYYIIPATGALLEAGSDSEAGNAGAELMEDSVSPDAEEGTMFKSFQEIYLEDLTAIHHVFNPIWNHEGTNL